jgi:hypothetical protein
MKRLLGLAAFYVLALPAAWASDDWGGHDFDALIASPGTRVILSKANDEDERREIRLANGVSFFQTRRNGKVIGVLGNDNSGHGAVLCGISQILTVRNLLSVCAPRQSAEEIAELDSQLDRIADFAVANSLPPQPTTSKAAIQSQIEQAKAKVAADAASATPDNIATYCNIGDGAMMLSRYRGSWGDGKLKRYVDDLLSVPRPPVSNPCM